MRLVFLYGPPASGKLTVARKICQSTGYCLFDNSLSVNLTKSVFQFGSKAFVSVCREVRYIVFQRAVDEGIEGVVFTFCYSHPRDWSFVEKVEGIVVGGGGRIDYVHLFAATENLEKRVLSQGRREGLKIDSVDALRVDLRNSNYTPIPGRDSLLVDTTTLSPAEVSRIVLTGLATGGEPRSQLRHRC